MEGVSSLEPRGVLTPKLSPSRRSEGSRRAWLGATAELGSEPGWITLGLCISLLDGSRFHFPI